MPLCCLVPQPTSASFIWSLVSACSTVLHNWPAQSACSAHTCCSVLTSSSRTQIISSCSCRIPALSLSLPQVQQYRQAVQAIIKGDTAAATPLLLQLLNEPLLQPAAQDGSSGTANAAAAAVGGSPSAAQRKAQQQQQQVLQSRNLQGMRPKVLLSLAPLLGQTQKALELWAEALSYDPNNAKIWEELSIVLAHLGHLRLAVQAADRAVGLRSSDVTLLERLAVMLAAQQVSYCHVWIVMQRTCCGTA